MTDHHNPSPITSAANTVCITVDDDGIRLDRWFQRHYPHLGFGAVNKLLRTGQVRLNGGRVAGTARIHHGDTLRLPPAHILMPAEGNVPLTRGPTILPKYRSMLLSNVLFENSDFIVINKPPRLSTQGGTGVKISVDDLSPTLVPEGAAKPRLVHRLDRDTSGVLALAKSAAAASFLAEAFQTRTVRKIYWAVVDGKPKPARGVVRVPLTRVDGAFDKIRSDPQGDPAITHYNLHRASPDGRLSWLQLEPETGRMHQLRVHCASLGTPIVGDSKYNPRFFKSDSKTGSELCLHARTLWLPLRDGTTQRVEAPLPRHMVTLWHEFDWDSTDE